MSSGIDAGSQATVGRTLMEALELDFEVAQDEFDMEPVTHFAQDLPVGGVKCLFAACVDDFLASLELSPAAGDQPPIVVLHWAGPPRIDAAIRQTVDGLASAARTAWPSWFGIKSVILDGVYDGNVANASMALGTNEQWARKAWTLARADRPPLPSGFSNTIAVRNLALAIDPEPLSIVLAVAEAYSPQFPVNEPHFDGLCRLAQWLATHTGGRICLLLDRSLQGRPELASVDFEPRLWPDETVTQSSEQADRANVTPRGAATNRAPPRRQHGTMDSARNAWYDEDKLQVWPLIGRPHPASPGEQMLAAALTKDPILNGLFEFNRMVSTVHGTSYIVDLLAESERVVVEVDGYRHHQSRVAFSIDRQRDFDLHTSGYLVLRLPHHEVVADSKGALEKIRRFVSFRQNNPLSFEGVDHAALMKVK